MKSKTFVIGKEGLRSHEAAMLVQTACKYECLIEMEHGTKCVNAKSMMGVLSLGMMSGENLVCRADGEREDEAIAEIESLIKSDFKPGCGVK